MNRKVNLINSSSEHLYEIVHEQPFLCDQHGFLPFLIG